MAMLAARLSHEGAKPKGPAHRRGAAGRYVQDLLSKLLAASPVPHREILVSIAPCKEFADGASVGRSITLCSATLHALESESELAFLLGHEAAHVLLRHRENDPEIIAANKDSVRQAALVWGPHGEAATEASNAQKLSEQRRNNEREADLIGLDLAVAAGFNPLAADSFLDWLARSYLARQSFAEKTSEKRSALMRRELDKANPDAGVLGAYAMIARINKGIASSVNDAEHDDAVERQKMLADYVDRLYRPHTSRPVGKLPWRQADGQLLADTKLED